MRNIQVEEQDVVIAVHDRNRNFIGYALPGGEITKCELSVARYLRARKKVIQNWEKFKGRQL